MNNLKRILITFSLFIFFSMISTFKIYGANVKKVQLATGETHSVLLNENGTVWSWGANNFGQLGNGTEVDNLKPTQIINAFGGENITAIASGSFHNIALSDEGNLWTWGWNSYGQLGSLTESTITAPRVLTSVSNVTAVAAGYSHSLALKEDGTVWAWGQNDLGQLGDNSTKDSHIPVQVSSLKNIVAISANYKHNLALDLQGNIWFWGENWGGQVGNVVSASKTPKPLTLPKDESEKNLKPAAISTGRYHSIALMMDGTVWSWGFNPLDNLENSSLTPVKVQGLDGVVKVSAGYTHNLAVKRDGSLWAFGLNGFGELGDGTKVDSLTPVLVKDMDSVESICAGNSYNLALNTQGNFFSWGLNTYGQLGDESLKNHYTPISLNLSPVTGVTLNKSDVDILAGSTYQLYETITPYNATNKNVTWSSSNPYIAYVDSQGKVTARGYGPVTITVETEDGKFKTSCRFNVLANVSGISLSKTSLNLILNKTNFDRDTIHATIYPYDAANADIIWTSSNSNIAAVDSNGLVIAKRVGTATITAATSDGKHKASADVTVTSFEGSWNTIKKPELVDINKHWKINFNFPVAYTTITKDNIYIKDEYGNEVNADIYFVDKNNNISIVNSNNYSKSIIIIPREPYIQGRTYYLYLENNIKSKTGYYLKEGIKMQFKVKQLAS